MQHNLQMPDVIDRLHNNCGVDYRHIMFPLDTLGTVSGFGPMNDMWIKGRDATWGMCHMESARSGGARSLGYLCHLLYICDRDCMPEH